MTKWSSLAAPFLTGSMLLAPRAARADDAIVSVGGPIALDGEERGFAPPPPEAPLARPDEERAPRSSVRFAAGPVGIATKHGLGYGAGASIELGKRQLGFRLAGSWSRGEAAGPTTSTGDGSIGIYQAEITMDPLRGALRPLGGLGAGILHAGRGGRSGTAGIATARLGFDYVMPITDVDARVGTQVTAGILGPADDELDDLRTFALVDLHLTIGF